jgi:hypothetical protein
MSDDRTKTETLWNSMILDVREADIEQGIVRNTCAFVSGLSARAKSMIGSCSKADCIEMHFTKLLRFGGVNRLKGC